MSAGPVSSPQSLPPPQARHNLPPRRIGVAGRTQRPPSALETRMTLTPHNSPPGLTGEQSTLGQRLGGLCWVLALVQNLLVQFWVASAWPPPYDWSRNYISDLGNTG